MAKQLTWRQAIIKVLEDAEGDPIHYADIAREIGEKGLRRDVGPAPANYVASQISTSMKRYGAKSPFERVARGQYRLRGSGGHTQESSPEAETTNRVINALGMYWNRADVDWNPTEPKLLGKETEESVEVDFCKQIGVYLLYDGRDVVYVGQSTEGKVTSSIGRRLRDHTRKRMKARWDRFSWFGLCPIKHRGGQETAKVVEQEMTVDAKGIINVLEAVLIEAMEPAGNRRQGENFKGLEYFQVVDPEIANKRAMEFIQDKLKTN